MFDGNHCFPRHARRGDTTEWRLFFDLTYFVEGWRPTFGKGWVLTGHQLNRARQIDTKNRHQRELVNRQNKAETLVFVGLMESIVFSFEIIYGNCTTVFVSYETFTSKRFRYLCFFLWVHMVIFFDRFACTILGLCSDMSVNVLNSRS